MNPSMLSEMLLPLGAALVLLTAIKAAMRRPAAKSARHAATPKARAASRQALRGLAKKGAGVATISQSTRTPHDVISLALYVEQRKLAGFRSVVRS